VMCRRCSVRAADGARTLPPTLPLGEEGDAFGEWPSGSG